jgi:hypothetical protein
MRTRNAEVIASLIAGDVRTAGGVAADEDLEMLGHLIVGSGEQVARWWLERPRIPKEQALERFLAATEAAIGQVLSGA